MAMPSVQASISFQLRKSPSESFGIHRASRPAVPFRFSRSLSFLPMNSTVPLVDPALLATSGSQIPKVARGAIITVLGSCSYNRDASPRRPSDSNNRCFDACYLPPWNPFRRLLRNFDRVASIYDSTRGLPNDVMESVVDAIAEELRGAAPVLDAGVGTGRFGAPLAARGLDLTGLDVSGAMLSEAKKKSLRNLVRGELTAMPFADASFESCLMIHVLHLVENPSAVLSEITRVCRAKVLSLVETSDTESVRECYARFMREAGQRWEETSERELARIVPPTVLKEVVSYATEDSADDEIEHFRQRLSAATWDVPDKVHWEIIGRLKSTLGGTVIRQNKEIRLAMWDVARLRSVNLLP